MSNSGSSHLPPSGRPIGCGSSHLHHPRAIRTGFTLGGASVVYSGLLADLAPFLRPKKAGQDQKPANHRPPRGCIYRDLDWFVPHGLRTLAWPRRSPIRRAEFRLDDAPHLVAGDIRLNCFMNISDPIRGHHFFKHRPGNGIDRRSLRVRRRCRLESILLRRCIGDELRTSLRRRCHRLCNRSRRRRQAGNCRWEHDDRHEKFIHGSLRIIRLRVSLAPWTDTGSTADQQRG